MPGKFLANLDADAAAAVIEASADVVLALDAQGVIQDLALASEDLATLGCAQWRGQPWPDTVTIESRPKIEALLAPGKVPGEARLRQVNHLTPGQADLPISYAVVPVGTSGSRLAFGRDLRPQAALQQQLVTAQLSMERDHWRLRQLDTRYRLLLQTATEPVLLLKGSVDHVEEANPAALQLFGDKARRPGWSLGEGLEPDSLEALRQTLERLRTTGSAEPLTVRLSGQAQPLHVAAQPLRQDSTQYFLLRLTGAQTLPQPTPGQAQRQLAQLLAHTPDAMVVTETSGHVLAANQAFLDMAQLASEDQARGQLLDKWLGRTGVEFRVLVSNLRQHGTVRLFAAQMQGEQGALTEVEISAVALNEAEPRGLGFAIRDVGRRLSADGRGSKELPRSAGQMTELVGRMPLKDIVRETTDLIEQLCIEAALELTGNNRASAAEMLGLSRQSLYIKLRRFGIGEAGGDDPEAEAPPPGLRP